jgi:hypothetical protein
MRVSAGALLRANKPAPLQADTRRREVRRALPAAALKAGRRAVARKADGRWAGIVS